MSLRVSPKLVHHESGRVRRVGADVERLGGGEQQEDEATATSAPPPRLAAKSEERF